MLSIFGDRKDLQYFIISLFFLHSLDGSQDRVRPDLSFLPPPIVEDRLVENEREAGPPQGEDEEEGFV